MFETSRVEAFSDGVFAVAITLLVLDLRDPGGDDPLGRRLLDLWPNYAAYAVSFLVIGIIWVNHHDTFRRFAAVDRPLQFLNLLLLMTVAAIPFPTAVLAEHLTDSHDSHVAALAYGLVMTLMGIAFTLLWRHGARHPELLVEGHDAAYARLRTKRSAVGPVVYAAAALVGLISAPVSLALFAAVAIYFALARGTADSEERA